MRKPEAATYLNGSGDSEYAAREDHDHAGTYATANHTHSGVYEPANASLMKAAAVQIKAEDWEDSAVTVPYPSAMQTFVDYVVASDSAAASTAAALVLTSAGESGLTFGVTTTPESNLNLIILYC